VVGGGDERADGGALLALAERPRRLLGHHRVGVVEERHEIDIERDGVGECAPSHRRVGVVQRGDDVGRDQALHACQRVQRRRPDVGIDMVEQLPRRVLVAGVAGLGRSAPRRDALGG